MPNNRRLHHQITELQQQWDLLSEKLSRLEQDKILETRAEEKFRIEHLIEGAQTERREIEQRLGALEEQLSSPKRDDEESSFDGNGNLDTEASKSSITIQRLPEFADALQRHTLALFIGADLPRELSGLPSRTELACELARRHGLDESLSLAEVAQRVSQAGNRWEFTDFIRSALDITGRAPQLFHKRIAALVKTCQIETMITTTYDNLLELAFREVNTGINAVVRGSDLNFISPDRPTLLKLYGDAQQPDTLVVTDRDHSDLLRDRDKEPLLDEVRRMLRRNTVLFLGYNLIDPDFRFLFDQVAESRFARTAYAVWPGLPEADMRMWQDRGIVILDKEPLEILEITA